MGSCGHMRRERERDRRATNRAVRKRGTEVPTRSASSGEGEIECAGGGEALPPVSPPCVALSLPQGMAPLLTGPSVDER
jgi:hypothetical protein